MMMLPTLFISHGSPDLLLRNNEVSQFLRGLGQKLPTPKSIIIISAHWVTKGFEILANPNPKLIYDFYGFPKELYEQSYPARNELDLVEDITKALREKEIKIEQNSSREGYDHGVWSPLAMLYPDAQIPIVQLSFGMDTTLEELMRLGEVLKEFREESMLLASGNLTHNLRDVDWRGRTPTKEYARVFRDWLVQTLKIGDIEALKAIQDAPYFYQNHPTSEHILPLFINLGASTSYKGESLLHSYMFGNLAMDTIIFND